MAKAARSPFVLQQTRVVEFARHSTGSRPLFATVAGRPLWDALDCADSQLLCIKEAVTSLACENRQAGRQAHQGLWVVSFLLDAAAAIVAALVVLDDSPEDYPTETLKRDTRQIGLQVLAGVPVDEALEQVSNRLWAAERLLRVLAESSPTVPEAEALALVLEETAALFDACRQPVADVGCSIPFLSPNPTPN